MDFALCYVTVINMIDVPVCEAESVAAAWMAQVPAANVTDADAPGPNVPDPDPGGNDSYAQDIDALISPSMSSIAVPVKLIEPAGWLELFAGDVIVTTGGLSTGGAASTVIEIFALPDSPPPFCPDMAVIVCVPTDRAVVANVLPLPMVPSRLDVHVSVASMTPSMTSKAEPVNVIESPAVYVERSGGADMLTDGVVYCGVILSEVTSSNPVIATRSRP